MHSGSSDLTLRGGVVGVVGLRRLLVPAAVTVAVTFLSYGLVMRGFRTAAPSAVAPLGVQPAAGSRASAVPTSLAQAASLAVGSSDRSFWPSARGARVVASAAGIRSTFSPAGLTVSTAQGFVTLSTGHLIEPAGHGVLTPTHKSVARNEVRYAAGSLAETYRTGPMGVEQSFVIQRRPLGDSGTLEVAMRVGGDLIARSSGTGVVFSTRSGNTAVRYTNLSAVDANGHRLHAEIAARGHTLDLRVADAHAEFPVRIDPFILQGAPLNSGDEAAAGLFGFSVALSSDGTTAVIGGPDGSADGGAWFFTRTGTTWSQQGAVQRPGGQGFGWSVALSADGNIALIGAFESSVVYWYTRTGGVWSQQQETAVGAPDFGYSVGLSADGNTAVAGGPGGFGAEGAVYVFTKGATYWELAATLTGGAEESGEGQLGQSVAVSSNGETVLAGAPLDGPGRTGAVWVFRRAGSVWQQQGPILTGPEEPGAKEFGTALAVAGDGGSALISDHSATAGAEKVWAVVHASLGWARSAQFPGYTAFEGSRTNIALSAHGNTAVIGPDIYSDGPAGWSAPEIIEGTEGAESSFGFADAISSTANTVLVGGVSGDSDHGAAWAFGRAIEPPELGRCAKSTASQEGHKKVYHGAYTSASCTTASPTHTGKFEWLPGAESNSFTTSLDGGKATLETSNRTKTTCNTEHGSGEYTETSRVYGVTLTFTGCEQQGTVCTTPGLAPGELSTEPLEGVVGWLNRPRHKLALDLYTKAGATPIAQFECAGHGTTILTGSVIAPLTSDKMASTNAISYVAARGHQHVTHLENEPPDTLSATTNHGPAEPVGLAARLSLNNAEPLEINAVN
jgi:hypothetical protein